MLSGSRRSIEVPVKTLRTFLEDARIDEVEFLKIDIEGMEGEVFESFFQGAAPRSWPRYICTETLHSADIADFLGLHGYRTLYKGRENSVFELRRKS